MFENPAWIAVVVSAAALIFTMVDRRGTKNDTRIKALEARVALKAEGLEVTNIAERVDKVEDRMTTVEGEVRHLPDKDTAHNIEMRVSDLSGQVGMLAEQLKPVTAMASRIQEALIEQVRFK